MARVATRRVLVSRPPAASGAPTLLLHYDFSDASKLWTDTGMTTNVASDGDAIAAVSDLVGSNHLTQGTSGARPLYKTNVYNGQSAGLFDGSDDYINTTTASGLSITNPFAIFMVMENLATAANGGDFQGGHFCARAGTEGDSAANGWAMMHFSGVTGPQSFVFRHGGDVEMSITPGSGGAIAIYLVWVTATAANLYRGGGVGGTSFASDTTFTARTLAPTQLVIGARPSALTSNRNVRAAEFRVYKDATSAAGLNTIGAALATKWGLSWSNIS